MRQKYAKNIFINDRTTMLNDRSTNKTFRGIFCYFAKKENYNENN